ncbi:MAG: acyl-CoA desaturase [Pseudomonadales bacterium]|nr:acyl-CoA desaturase [Pseudomonadales bacterium]
MSSFSLPRPLTSLVRWFDAHASAPGPESDGDRSIDLVRILPFAALHLACGFALLTGVSGFALAVLAVTYAIRVLGITVGYHRYFSHRAFRAGRGMQFVLALMGASAVQRGPLWWAAHHRHHHRHSDQPEDAHSPVQDSFWWSHMFWFLANGNYRSRVENISDFAKFPELRFLDRFDTVVPIASYVGLFLLGDWVGRTWPGTGTNGWQVLVWGGVIGTVLAYHATFTINSLVHVFGRKRYATGDESRNNGWLWPVTFGESWHNNHHHFPASARLGFYWWEIDIGWYFLRALERLGLVWDLKVVPFHVREGLPNPRLAERARAAAAAAGERARDAVREAAETVDDVVGAVRPAEVRGEG